MCVTLEPADIRGTSTYVYAAPSKEGEAPRHICGYQNVAKAMGSSPNCMFLNFAGRDLALVRGPERTHSLMTDMTEGLPTIEPVIMTRGGGMYGGSKGIMVEEYGDYTVILAQGSADILDALETVRPDRRPMRTAHLEAMVNFYMSFYSTHSFMLGCFSGNVKPRHPITVSYEPLDAEMLTIPGLDGHDGKLPEVGAPVHRNFKIAFGVAGTRLPIPVHYTDPVSSRWAPETVTGFVDNREVGPNGDYVMSITAVQAGLVGRDLADQLISSS